MKRLIYISTASLALIVSACATQTGWRPTVDPYGNPNSGRLSQDMYECDMLAHQASGGTFKETAKGAAVGGLIGAAGGAALGAIAGHPGKGAAIGATVGGFGGGAKEGFGSEDRYKQAYRNCLRHRGHYVLD
ncbi:MAG: glycine zipper family protein [Gammaproteobacteria bacterium]